MNIRFLETFLWLVRLKSFRATAEKLNTTQPNVSSRIAKLEDHFNTALYVRGAKDFELTAAGRHLVEYAEKITLVAEEMQQAVGEADRAAPVLRVGIIELVTMSWLPEFVRRAKNSENFSEVDFVTETSDELIAALRNDEIDLALVWGPMNEPHIKNIYICNYAMQWLGKVDAFPIEKEIDIIDIANLPVISTRVGTSGHSVVKEYFASYGLESVPGSTERITMNSYSLATSMQLVKEGLGIMAMPPFVLCDEIAKGEVKILPVKQQLPPVYLTACYKTLVENSAIDQFVLLAQEAAEAYAAETDPTQFWI